VNIDYDTVKSVTWTWRYVHTRFRGYLLGQ